MCIEKKNVLLNCIFLCPVLLALQCNSIFNTLRTSSSSVSPWSFFFLLLAYHNNLWLSLLNALATLTSDPSWFLKGMPKTCCTLYSCGSSFSENWHNRAGVSKPDSEKHLLPFTINHPLPSPFKERHYWSCFRILRQTNFCHSLAVQGISNEEKCLGTATTGLRFYRNLVHHLPSISY